MDRPKTRKVELGYCLAESAYRAGVHSSVVIAHLCSAPEVMDEARLLGIPTAELATRIAHLTFARRFPHANRAPQ